MRAGEWRKWKWGECSVSVELVGRSGAAPPVIIRVTAARARLCAACTRRDVLPREKSEHLSVPPRRQQPPTSLSNSTQLVTRSPNSYFLSLAHSRTPTLNYSPLLFLFCSLPFLLTASLIRSLFRTGCESCRPPVQFRFGLKWVLCECNANAHSTTERRFHFRTVQTACSLSVLNINCIVWSVLIKGHFHHKQRNGSSFLRTNFFLNISYDYCSSLSYQTSAKL